MRLMPLATAVALSALLAACQSAGTRPAGNAALAVPPGAAAAPPSGTVVGGLVGGDIGRNLDDADRTAAYSAEYEALDRGRAGTPITWRNPRSGHYGEVTPGPSYDVNEYSCRDYAHTVYVDGQSQTARGTACREPDGNWRPVS